MALHLEFKLLFCTLENIKTCPFIKPGAHLHGFLKLLLFVHQYVCVSAPEGINNQWHDCGIDRVCLVKQILALNTFQLLYT